MRLLSTRQKDGELRTGSLAHSMSMRRSFTASIEPEGSGEAILKMPDGREIHLPALIDAAGNEFVDVRKLQPE